MASLGMTGDVSHQNPRDPVYKVSSLVKLHVVTKTSRYNCLSAGVVLLNKKLTVK